MAEENLQAKESGGVKAFKDALKTTTIILKVTMVILLIAFACSGMKNLEQYEKAVVLRFGAQNGAVRSEPGLHFAMPFPIDQVITVQAGRTQTLTSQKFMYKKNKHNEVAPHLVPGVDGYLLTADANILHCEATLKYSVSNVTDYAFSVRDDQKDQFLKNLMDSAIRKAIAKLTLEEALDRVDLISDSKLILQKSIDGLELGAKVEQLEVNIIVPRQVEEARQEVTTAIQEASQMRANADSDKRKKVNEAESEAAIVQSKAEIWKATMISRAKADLKTFVRLLDRYKRQPKEVKQMLIRDMMIEVTPNLDEIFVFNINEDRELRIIMPRKPPMKKKKNDGN